MILADKIIEERKKNGWTQEDLAQKLGVSRQSVSKWESAGAIPDLKKIIQLADLFGVSTDYLLKDEIEKEKIDTSCDTDCELHRMSMEEANAYMDEKKTIVESVLNTFIFRIKVSPILLTVYKYYVSDQSQMSDGNRVKIDLNFDSIKLQIKRKILSQKNNYWNIKDSEIKIVEDLKDEELDSFKNFINKCLNENLDSQIKEMEMKEEAEKSEEENRIKKILYPKEDLLFEAVKKIIENNREFPYKSDKIKAFLSIALNTEQIYAILAGYENLVSQMGYIEKFRQERTNQISEGKIKVYPQEESVKIIMQR